MIKTTTYKLDLIFTAPLLGSQPAQDIATHYLAARHGVRLADDELDMLPAALEKGTTVFHRTPSGQPALLSYQVLGFLKEAGKALNGKCGVRNLRWKVSTYVSITPRILPIQLPEDGAALHYLERPLRAETAQGPRVALARSEMIAAGARLSCGLEIIDSDINEEILRDLLDYGWSHGLGQWRTSGAYGTFRYTLTPDP